jgi:hypothetical protein
MAQPYRGERSESSAVETTKPCGLSNRKFEFERREIEN